VVLLELEGMVRGVLLVEHLEAVREEETEEMDGGVENPHEIL
jgi:hypothetical protein